MKSVEVFLETIANLNPDYAIPPYLRREIILEAKQALDEFKKNQKKKVSKF